MAGGAPYGNTNSNKGKLATEALIKALAENKWRRLRQGANAIANAFADGEQWAAQLVFDRLDGKAALTLPETSGTLVISWMTTPTSEVKTIQESPHQDVIEHIPHNTPQDVDVNVSKPGFQAHTPLDVVVSDTTDQAQSSADTVDPSAAD